jgi:hypothetical protein
MDTATERQRLENEKRAIQQWLDHPITRKIITDNKEQQEALMPILVDHPIVDIESFFKHFEAVGHLRGLRRQSAIIKDDVEEIEEQLKALPNE